VTRAPLQLFGLWSVCSKIDVISFLLRVKPPPHVSSDFLESVCEERERERERERDSVGILPFLNP
jgi:hypothetical protein